MCVRMANLWYDYKHQSMTHMTTNEGQKFTGHQNSRRANVDSGSTPGEISHTVLLISTAHFAVGILLLHNYRSNLAHLSDLYSLVIGLYKSEIWANNN